MQVKGLQNTANVFVELSSYMESGQNLSIPLTGEYSGSSLILQGTTPFYFSLQVKYVNMYITIFILMRELNQIVRAQCYFNTM